MSERIVAAAIRYKGVSYSVPAPGRHHNVMTYMRDNFGLGIKAHEEEGFMTDRDRFVDREEAWFIAELAGQLLPIAPTDRRGGTLYSEDVW